MLRGPMHGRSAVIDNADVFLGFVGWQHFEIGNGQAHGSEAFNSRPS